MRNKLVLLFVLILFGTSIFAITEGMQNNDRPKGLLNPAPFASVGNQRDWTLLNSQVLYFQNFDNLTSGWTGDWNIGEDLNQVAFSTPNCAFTAHPYLPNAEVLLTSPFYLLPELAGSNEKLILSFESWWETESTYDFVYVDVLIDGSVSGTVFTQTGFVTPWQTVNIDISQFAGENIQLRFRLTSDGSDQYSGWAIDDVRIDKNTYEQTVEMNLLSLNVQNFPFIYSTLSLSMEDENLDELTAANFQVYENEMLQTNFFEVIPPSTGAGSRLVDIAFLMDNSGSMSSSISAVSNNVTNFINNLGSSGVDSALGLCRYGSNYNSGNPFLEDQGLLSTNLQYFRDSVWARNDISGGYEPGYYAMTQSLAGFNWRPGSQKVMIIITDETPDQGGAGLYDALNACTNSGAILFALTYSGLYSTFTPITEATGGNVFDINSSFDAILAQISQIIVSNYIISYRSSSPTYDGVLRNIRYVMNHEDLSAEATGSYFPGQAPQIVRTPATVNMDTTPMLDNQDIQIAVQISDSYAPFTSSALLYYKTLAQRNFTNVSMVHTGNDIWVATIPATAVSDPGVAYYISATDGQSTATLPSVEPSLNPFNIAVLPNIAPEIIHQPAPQVMYYTPLYVSAMVTDETPYVTSVELYYRRYGQLTYTQVPMEALGDNMYGATIPASVVANNGVEYYVRALDEYGMASSIGFADSPVLVPGLIDGVIIPGGDITDTFWGVEDSPYYVSGDVTVQEGSTLEIEAGVSVYFSSNVSLEVNGGLLADSVTFSASDPSLGWAGIFVESATEDVTIQNCIIEYALNGLSISNSNGTLSNNIIRKGNAEWANELGMNLLGNSSPNISNLLIENYGSGFEIQNEDTRTISTPSLTNIRIRTTSSSSRTTDRGLSISGSVALQLENAEIDGYGEGLYYDGQNTSYATNTPSLTNVRIRTTSSSSRNNLFGMKLIDLSHVSLENDSIVGFTDGLIIENSDATRAINTPTLTNIRIRGTSSSSRSSGYGIKLNGAVNATLDDIEIDDFDYGIMYQGVGMDFGRTTPTLSNIRIRTTSSSSRVAGYGVKLQDLAAIISDNCDIDGYPTGFDVSSTDDTRVPATATLTNIRIRTTSSSSRQDAVGFLIHNMHSVNMEKNIVYSTETLPSGEVFGKGILMDAVQNANIYQNTIWGFENGLTLDTNSQATFDRNVIYTAGAALANPITTNGGSTVEVSNSDISVVGGVYPGVGNIDKNPKFADPPKGNFYLKPRSPLRDTGIGALPFDFTALAMVYTYSMHPGWNLMGVPYMTNPATATPANNSPVAIFADDLFPFYVSPTYTSILQYNTNALPDSLGHIRFTHTGAYNVPTAIRSGVGAWVRNAATTPVEVDVLGLLDDEEYLMELPGMQGTNNGWYLLANPYDAPINFVNGSIALEGNIQPMAYVYSNNLSNWVLADNDPTNDNEYNITEIPAWSAFFVKANLSTDKVKMYYPPTRSQSQDTPIYSGNFTTVPSQKPAWEIQILANSESNSDVVTLGVSESSNQLYDPMDVPDFPRAPFGMANGLSLAVNNHAWQQNPGLYKRDIRNLDANAWSWNLLLNVESLLENGRYTGTISIGLPQSMKAPAGYSYQIVNEATGESANLLSETLILNLDIDTAMGESCQIPLRIDIISSGAWTVQEAIIATGSYPNPFNPSTTISFTLGKESHVNLDIYNLKGQMVNRLFSGTASVGTHSTVWNGKDMKGNTVASGFYFYRLSANGKTVNKKILLMK